MALASKVNIRPYLREDRLPHIWCPGCGHGIIVGALLRAIHLAGLPRDQTVVVSGIGCSSRATTYLDFDTLHTTHGRALAFATGIKLARPNLHVIVLTGDGDAAAIGGNHLIHAARRNIGITCVCMNNSTYGMTSGQHSPTTPPGARAATAPYGNIDPPFDLCQLAAAAGASYVARGIAAQPRQLERLILRGLQNGGFSFIEAVSQCPTYYGRKNRLGDAFEMMERQKALAIPASKAALLPPAERAGRIVVGELAAAPRLEYTRADAALVARAQEEG